MLKRPDGGLEQRAQRCQQSVAVGIGADRDPQMLIDSRHLEMPHENLLLLQARGERGGIVFRMAREYEIRRRRHHIEAQRLQVRRQPLAARDDLRAGFAKPVVVFNGRDRGDLRQPVERIGIEAVLHARQRLDQRFVSRVQSRRACPPVNALSTTSARPADSDFHR